jgi:hypothetical protein
MALRRPKHPVIYATVSDWWDNANGVPYIAHAILNTGNAVALLDAAVEGDGNQNFPMNHPDQQFWADNLAAIRQRLLAHYGNIRRIEVDCALLPCTVAGGCSGRVPALIRAVDARLDNLPLRIFSHRDEHMNGPNNNTSSKRYIAGNTHDDNAAATVAYNANDGWGWGPWLNNQGYL